MIYFINTNLDEFVAEIVDKTFNVYWHGDSQGTISDSFADQRIWFHWYMNPQNLYENWNYGSPFFKYYHLFVPASLAFYWYYIYPNTRKKRIGYRYARPVYSAL